MSVGAARPARAFFALWPDRPTALALAAWQPAGAPPVRVEDLHLTIAFLGAVDTTALAALALDLSCPSFDLRLVRSEYWAAPRVQVALPQVVPAALLALRAQLCARLVAAGAWRADDRPFRPHVTLTRAGAASGGGPLPAVDWHARALTLAVSDPVPDGPRYRRLATLPFAPAAG